MITQRNAFLIHLGPFRTVSDPFRTVPDPFWTVPDPSGPFRTGPDWSGSVRNRKNFVPRYINFGISRIFKKIHFGPHFLLIV